MRRMHDAVQASRIPPGGDLVAGYCDTIRIPQWSDADWARFPAVVKVRIAKKASTDDGHVLDVELGDATPAQAPGWVQLRRKAGVDPTVYCNMSTWPAVKAAFRAAKVAEPHYWIAKYDGNPTIPQGAIAKQYINTAYYDVSSVADYWPGVDSAPAVVPASGRIITDDEEWNVKLDPGDHRSLSFDIPPGASKIRVNCPMDYLTVHGIWQAGDLLPAGTDFDWKWSWEKDFRVDRLRPWVIDVVSGATQGSIIYTYGVGHPERTASLSFR